MLIKYISIKKYGKRYTNALKFNSENVITIINTSILTFLIFLHKKNGLNNTNTAINHEHWCPKLHIFDIGTSDLPIGCFK